MPSKFSSLYRKLANSSGHDLVQKFYSDLPKFQQLHGITRPQMLADDADNTGVTPMDTESPPADGSVDKPAASSRSTHEDAPTARVLIGVDRDSDGDSSSKTPTVDVDSLFQPLQDAQVEEVLTALREQVSKWLGLCRPRVVHADCPK